MQLVGERASGNLLVRTEDAEKAPEQKASPDAAVEEGDEEVKDAAADKHLVKEQVLEGPSRTSTSAARSSPGSTVQGVKDAEQYGEEGVLDGPAFHAAPGMPKLDVKTYERLKKAYCGEEVVKSFIYAAEGEGTLHVMAAVGNELFVLDQTDRPEGRSHGQGPVPRWFRLALAIAYAPDEPNLTPAC